MPMENSWHGKIIEAVCAEHGWNFNAPLKDLPPEALKYILYTGRGEKVVIGYRHERGENTYGATFEGIIPNLERRFRETESEFIKSELERYMVARPCPTCVGKRLKPEILAVTVDGRNIWQVSTLSI
jgi:excinuclease ABC subunit A